MSEFVLSSTTAANLMFGGAVIGFGYGLGLFVPLMVAYFIGKYLFELFWWRFIGKDIHRHLYFTDPHDVE